MKHKLMFNSLLLLALAPAAYASTTWYVNGVSGSDTNNCKSPTTACKTIGHAISLASSGDSIIVSAATYAENLTISKSLKIIGSSASTTIIDGRGAATVITISNNSASVILSGMTIRRGVAVGQAGGVYNSGHLTITSTTISQNVGLGTFTSISLGGGIYNRGTLTIYNSTVSGNLSRRGCESYPKECIGGSGGGIYNRGTLTIYNSTVSGNVAEPGKLCFFVCHSSGSGGGIENFLGTLTISNSTLSGNSAYQGGGIYNYSGGATLQNSIVANSPSGGNCFGYGTMTSKGYNMSSDGTCNFSNSGDRSNTNPMLGTLGNYGGPTQTIPLLSGSPAIDAGNPSGCTDGSGHLLKTDQRDARRPDKEDTGGCDMGAFERQGSD